MTDWSSYWGKCSLLIEKESCHEILNLVDVKQKVKEETKRNIYGRKIVGELVSIDGFVNFTGRQCILLDYILCHALSLDQNVDSL